MNAVRVSHSLCEFVLGLVERGRQFVTVGIRPEEGRSVVGKTTMSISMTSNG
jgi:hypothetical protein